MDGQFLGRTATKYSDIKQQVPDNFCSRLKK